MPLGPEGTVQGFQLAISVLQHLPLASGVPGGIGVANIQHRAPGNHQRRDVNQNPFHPSGEVEAAGKGGVQGDAQGRDDLKGVDDDGIAGDFLKIQLTVGLFSVEE